MPLVSINPATGETLHRFRETSARHVESALARAETAFKAWREVAPAQRAESLLRLAHTLSRERDALTALMVCEMGKPIAEARTEIEKCAAACHYYAEHGAEHLQPVHPVAAPASAQVVFEPLGPVLAIMPWNFPFWQTIRAAVPAMMAGNTVLLKHASNVGACALACEELMRRAGLPGGVFQTLIVTSARVPALIKDPRVRGVTLTGSTAAGRKVASLAGAALKPCVLELGGSDAYLVLEDADLDLAAETCAAARLINSGQSCVAAKRFIVVESVREAFEERFISRMAARRLGDPFSEDTAVGPLAREDLRATLHAQVRTSVEQGAKLVLGGKRSPGPGWFYEPSVLTGVRPGMEAWDKELFGPAAALATARDEATAIDWANQSPFGLGAAVFTRDRERGVKIARDRLEAGMTFVNTSVRSDPTLPFGGIKDSGVGRELGAWGTRSFVNTKTVWVE